MARLTEVGYRIVLMPRDGDGTHEEWRSTLASAGCAQGYFSKFETLNTRDVINYLLFDFSNPSSVKSCLAAARRNGRAQRTSLTRDMWESLNSAWIEFSNINPASISAGELPRVPGLGALALGPLPRRAPQHDPAQRHLLLQPARNLSRARRQHRPHPRCEVLRAPPADRDGRRRVSTRCSGALFCVPSRRTAATAGSTRRTTAPGASPSTSS